MKIIKKQTIFLATTLIVAFLLCGAVSAADEPNGNSVSDPTLTTTEQQNQATPDATQQSPDQVQASGDGPTGIVFFKENYKEEPAEKPLYHAQINEEVPFSMWVLNYGPDKATGLYVMEPLADGLEYTKHYTNIGTYDYKTGKWTIGEMNSQSDWEWPRDAGKYPYLQVYAIVKKTGTIINTATAYSDNYPAKSMSSTIIVNDNAADTTKPTVTATPAGGSYYSPQNVALAASETSNIFYTTDGSVPTKTSTAYATPINIDTSKTLKFTAWDPADNQSPVYIAQYLIYKLVTSSNTVNVPYKGWYKFGYKKWYKKWYRSHGKWRRYWAYKWRYKWKYGWLNKNVVQYSSKYELT